MTDVVADFGSRRELMRLEKRLGGGAAGDIYRVARHPELVAKIYRTPADRQQYQAKIEDMVRRPPKLPPIVEGGREFVQIAWPTAIVRDNTGGFLGFTMPAVDLKAATELENILQRVSRRSLGLPEFYGGRVLLAANLAALMAELHSLAHYFIDMKPVNVRFYPGAWYLAILDTDGFSIQGTQRWPAHQFSFEYIAPEATGKAPAQLGIEQDLFALAVIIFRLLNNGVHPYQGIDRLGNAPTALQDRIFAGLYAYGRTPSPHVAPARASIHDSLEDTTRGLFDRAFSGPPASRPSAREWNEHLRKLITGNIFVRCTVRPNEHGHFSKGCGQCALDRQRAGHLPAPPPAPPRMPAGRQMGGGVLGPPPASPVPQTHPARPRTPASWLVRVVKRVLWTIGGIILFLMLLGLLVGEDKPAGTETRRASSPSAPSPSAPPPSAPPSSAPSPSAPPSQPSVRQTAACLVSGVLVVAQVDFCRANGTETIAPYSDNETSPEGIKFFQLGLKSLGLYPGPIDGIWGAGTSAAFASFQRQRNLLPTGTLNDQWARQVFLRELKERETAMLKQRETDRSRAR